MPAEKAVVRRVVKDVGEQALERHRARVTDQQLRYRLDPFEFIRELQVWDPVKLTFTPFEPWDHQRELIEEWMDLELLRKTGVLRFRNTLVEKSRQMGDTVIVAAACLWVVTHHDAPLLMQHQDLQEVADSGPTWDSFFGKIKSFHDTQPWWIGKARLKFVGGNNPIIRNVGHPIRFITGEGQTPDPGRGGRYAAAVIDEAARVRYDQQAQAALQRACPDGRLMLSTPKGRGNVYYRIRTERPSGWTIIDHHWRHHPDYADGIHVAALAPDTSTDPPTPGGHAAQPDEMLERALGCRLCTGTIFGRKWDPSRKVAHRYPGKLTSAWYEDAVRELTDEQVAEELDIDYTASLSARVYGEFDERTHVLDQIPYEPALSIELSWDYGWDVTAVGVWQDAPGELRKIGEAEFTETLPSGVAAGLRETLRQLGVPDRLLVHDQTLSMLCVGDPAGRGTQLNSGEPLTADYLREGFSIADPGQQRVETTLKALKRLLNGRPKPVRYSRAGCPLTILHMQQNRWPTDAQGNRRVGSTKPLDDVHNHMCRADAYYATYKYPPPTDVPLTPDERGPASAFAEAFAGSVNGAITPDMKL